MRRSAARVIVTVGVLTATLVTAGATRAAGDIVLAVSPTSVAVGQPVEMLVRTFRVVERSDLSLPFEAPLEPYPVPSGVWNILYHWADYPFDVVAQHEDGTEVPVTLARDPSDATLWRGAVSLLKAGTWTIWVRNFAQTAQGSSATVKAPGSSATVTVVGGPPASTAPISPANRVVPATEASPAPLIGALLGLVIGFVIGRFRRRKPSPP